MTNIEHEIFEVLTHTDCFGSIFPDICTRGSPLKHDHEALASFNVAPDHHDSLVSPAFSLDRAHPARGACIIGMGFVQNFTQLFVVRLFLGATEAGLFPGVTFLCALATSSCR